MVILRMVSHIFFHLHVIVALLVSQMLKESLILLMKVGLRLTSSWDPWFKFIGFSCHCTTGKTKTRVGNPNSVLTRFSPGVWGSSATRGGGAKLPPPPIQKILPDRILTIGKKQRVRTDFHFLFQFLLYRFCHYDVIIGRMSKIAKFVWNGTYFRHF